MVKAELAWEKRAANGSYRLGLRLVWRKDESQLQAGRLHPRVEMNIPVWLRQQNDTFKRYSTLNLAAGGALLDLDQALEVGSSLQLYLDLGEGWEVVCDAVVVRVQPAFGGRRFTTAVTMRPRSRSDRNWLPHWLRQQVRRPPLAA